MQELDGETVLFSILLTWTIGLVPPLFIRFAFLKRPMGQGAAIGTALAFWIFNLGLFIALGSKSKSHAALVLVALASYWILRNRAGESEVATVEYKDKKNSPVDTSKLLTFAALGNVNAVRAQLDSGANIDASDSNGWTPLMYAAGRDELEVVRVLLERGATTQARNSEGKTAAQIAQEKGLDEIAGIIERSCTNG